LPIQSRTDVIRLVLLGDCHIGHAGTDEKLVEATAARIAQPSTYWVDLGDACDCINMKDPRFDPRELPDWIETADLADLSRPQLHRYTEIFSPVADRCLVRLSGNHEEDIMKHYGRDIYTDINNALELPDERRLGYCGFLRLRMPRITSNGTRTSTWSQTLFLHHGAGGGALAGAKALRLERLVMAYDADIYAVGHTHTKMVLQKRRYGMRSRGTGVDDRSLIMVNVGAFIRTAHYAVKRGLYPQGVGPVELWMYPDKQEIRIMQ
jgi:hypothetical protein